MAHDTPTTPPDEQRHDSLRGAVVEGRYRVKLELGTGAMGSVYLAEHTMMGHAVALKVLHPEQSRHEESVARFQREARAAAAINHPNICVATDFGRLDNGAFFLVMEYLEGDTLRHVMRQHGRLPPERAIHIVRQLAGALQSAHEQGIIHRDLKPANVMLVERGLDRDFVKLTDFGLAGLSEGSEDQVRLTMAGVVYGTPAYMSPEQANAADALDGRADLYALGGILFEMLTGELPFPGKTISQVLTKHLTHPPPSAQERAPDANIPDALDAIIRRLMAKKPEDRFPDAAALERELAHLASPDATSALEKARDAEAQRAPSLNLPSTLKTRARQRWDGLSQAGRLGVLSGTIFGAVCVLAAIIATALSLAQDPEPPTDPEERVDYRITQTTADLTEARNDFVSDTDAMPAILEDLASGDYRDAVSALEAMDDGARKASHYHYFMAVAHMGAEADLKAFDHLAQAIALDEQYMWDERVIDIALNGLASRDDAVEARAKTFLKDSLKDSAPIPLARMAYADGARRRRKRARALLEETKMWEALPTWRQHAIELRLDIGCKPRAAAIDKLANANHPGALGPLYDFADKPKTGCGRRDRTDCYGCIRDDLTRAITKLEAQFPDAARKTPAPAEGADAGHASSDADMASSATPPTQ